MVKINIIATKVLWHTVLDYLIQFIFIIIKKAIDLNRIFYFVINKKATT